MRRAFRVRCNAGRKNADGKRTWILRWVIPESGERRSKASGSTCKRTATRMALRLEGELNDGHDPFQKATTWAEATADFFSQAVPAKKKNTGKSIRSAVNAVERILKPKLLSDLTAKRLLEFRRVRLAEGRCDGTATTQLAYLRTVLQWCLDRELLRELPRFPKAARRKSGSQARGRPITAKEFTRMVDAVPLVVGGGCAAGWERLLRGLWMSGLRLSEGLALRWDAPGGIQIDLSGRRPLLKIEGDSQKSGRDQLCPLTPDFCQFLLAVPEANRHGLVFPLTHHRHPERVVELSYASRTISWMGERAAIVVGRYAHKRAERQIKYASAHDLRRSFGTRWSLRVSSVVLKELMRHSSLATTESYYLAHDAADLADRIWAGWEDDSKTGSSIPQ